MLKALIVLSFTALLICPAYAQSADNSTIIKTAVADAKKSKVGSKYAKQVRAHHLSATSDYFKPKPENVSEGSLLSDSTYVKTFRETSFVLAAKHRTFWHYPLVAGGIYASALTILTAMLFAGVLPHSE